MIKRNRYTLGAMLLSALVLTACSGNAEPKKSDTVQTAAEEKKSESAGEQTTAQQESQMSGDQRKGEWKIGLSNSYYGNTWRKQMVESFENVGKQAKADGIISDYEVQNGDSTVNAQIAQINSFTLEGMDAICICAASTTALNSAVDAAADKGIVVVAFDSIVSTDKAYTMDYDWDKYGAIQTDYVIDRLGGKGNVLIVRGVPGSSSDQGINDGIHAILDKEPGMKVAATVYGEASATKTQEEILKILPSLPEIDAVFTNGGGDSLGVVQAFEQAGKKVPIVIGDNSAEFIQWWIKEKEENGYETISLGTTPGCGGAAFWAAVNILEGNDVPRKMYLDIFTVTQDTVEDYKDLQPGTIVSPTFTNEYVVEKIINPAKEKK